MSSNPSDGPAGRTGTAARDDRTAGTPTSDARRGGAPRAIVRLCPVVLGLALIAPGSALAFNVTKPTVSSGAVATAGGSFRLGATIGEAGVVGVTAGGSFRLVEGFWRPGIGVPSAVENPTIDPGASPTETDGLTTTLWGNVPNPFASSTSIRFHLGERGPVALAVYAPDGRAVRTLVRGELSPGKYVVEWDGRDDTGRPLGAGVYFGRFRTERFARALTLIRTR